MAKKPKPLLRYVVLCVDGEGEVISSDILTSYTAVNDGFMVRFKKYVYYSSHFYQTNDLDHAWIIAEKLSSQSY